MLPKFVMRRIRWGVLFAFVGAIIANRHDAQRWWRFIVRSARSRAEIGTPAWRTEARARLAVTMEPNLRRSPAVQDMVVEGNEVVVFTDGSDWPTLVPHLGAVQRVKGVTTVRCVERIDEPDAIVDGVLVD